MNHAELATDVLLETIADYAVNKRITDSQALDAAGHVLVDSLGCALLALRFPECTKLLGPIVPGTIVPYGARVPGTSFVLDPVQAAFNIGTMIRWLDYNDCWLAAEWGHPSDNLGGILASADYLSRKRIAEGKKPLTMSEVLEAIVKAHEIQGVLALENSLNRHGLDHVLFVKVASTAVVTALLGGSKQQVVNALSNAWIDNGSLRTYRHAPNTGSRKSWAAGDATSRAVRLALISLQGEMGYQTALSAPGWGFQDVLFGGRPLKLARELDTYVIKNVLFKISHPAEFHAQTALECAIQLHEQVRDCLDHIEKVILTTQESAIRIIDKTGPLHNPADRDHCLQYIVAVGLIYGDLTADHYEDRVANDPRIDALRAKMVVVEDKRYSRDYLDPEKRSIANTIQICFRDGTKTEQVAIEYPIGHPRRRAEGLPLLWGKFRANMETRLPNQQVERILNLYCDETRFLATTINEFMDMFAM